MPPRITILCEYIPIQHNFYRLIILTISYFIMRSSPEDLAHKE